MISARTGSTMRKVAPAPGVGYLIAAASSRYDTALVFASILSLLVFVLVLNALVARFERYALRWQPRERVARASA